MVDEVHKLSNKNATNDKLFKLRSRFNVVVGLSGTPLQDKIEGLYNVVNFIRPGFFGTYKDYQNKYLVTKKKYLFRGGRKIKFDEVVGTKNVEELSAKLRQIMDVQFKKYDLDFTYKLTNMNTYERKCYVESAKGMADIMENEKEFSARLHDLQRVVDGSHELFMTSKLSSKERLFISTLSEVLARNESVLVFCEYEATYKRLMKVLKATQHIIKYSKIHLITGKVKFEDRVKVETNMPKKSIVLLTKAGTASINLQKANNIIFYSTPFTLLDVIQAIGRICRADSEYPKQHVYFLEVKDTIDTYKRKLVESKMSVVQSLFGETPTLPDIKAEEIDKDKLKQFLLWKKF